jgi:UDP-N-acetylmuramoyl-tripeptide--D-alanyl-D-alanine ligase
MTTPIPKNRAEFTVAELVAATGGVLTRVGDEHLQVTGIVTDSRAVAPGNGFVALRGESFDGHAFLLSALERGAQALITERGTSPPAGATTVLEVGDTRAAFGQLARAHLLRWRRRGGPGTARRTAAITGSAGKTTTKELVATILGAIGPCHATVGNLNNLIGVPAVALGVESERYAVFELGMSVPGEIAALSAIVEADVAALLNVGLAHAGSFRGARGEIALEKGAILEALGPDGVAVVNVDDEAAREQLRRCPSAKRVGFGSSPAADVRLIHRELVSSHGARVTIDRRGDTSDVYLPAADAASALDLVAAIAIADATVEKPIPWPVIANAIGNWKPAPGRSVVKDLGGELLVIDDSYNANPGSMAAALETLAELRKSRPGRAIAVLGEMLELGAIAEREHARIGATLARLGVEIAVGCGGIINAAMDAAENAGVVVHRASSAEQAGSMVAEAVRAGDVVLFKGSRGAGVEHALRVLCERWPGSKRIDEAS